MTATVLIADDHPLFRQALALAVQRVVPEARLAEAGTLAAGGSDAILADYHLDRGEDGLSLIAALRTATGLAVPALLVTAEGARAVHEPRRAS